MCRVRHPREPRGRTMSFVKDNEKYERWLRKHCRVVEVDLGKKHERMRESAFVFLRATFFRWAKRVEGICTDLAKTPPVLSVGDLHLENFGTWRDTEGRLIWGINDFDEAYPLPYTTDLVRLAVSAKLAIKAEHLAIKSRVAYDAILTGYTEGLKSGGQPFVLAVQHQWLRDIATNKLRDPVQFWLKMGALPPVKGAVPQSAKKALDHMMPE